jgi:hypothetical protein
MSRKKSRGHYQLPPVVIGPCKATDGADVAEVMNQIRDREEAAMVKRMVDRFLAWRLPKPWSPDGGISYQRPNYVHLPTDSDWPIGTNLFDATQAEAMIRHMLNLPASNFQITRCLKESPIMTSERDELACALTDWRDAGGSVEFLAGVLRAEIDRRIENALDARDSEKALAEGGVQPASEVFAELNSAAAASQIRTEPSNEDSGVATAADLCVCGHPMDAHSTLGCQSDVESGEVNQYLVACSCPGYRPAPPQAKDDLLTRLQSDCNHFVNGECRTAKCMAKNGTTFERPIRFVGCVEYQAAARIRELEARITEFEKELDATVDDDQADIAALQARIKELEAKR